MSKAARDTMQTVRDMVRFATTRFVEEKIKYGHGTDNAFDEACYLTLSSLNLPLDKLEPFMDARLTEAEINSLLQVIERRCKNRLPAPYLTHEAHHMGYTFYVDERVLIPRSFIGELLIETGLSPWIADPDAVRSMLDLCTGSGALAIQAAHVFTQAQIDALDLSTGALQVAQRNVEHYGLAGRVRLLESDVFSALSRERYDLIITNPPYVNAASIAALPPEFQHEPKLALAGGADGMDIVKRIVRGARNHLNRDGLLIIEIGHEKAHFEAAFPGLPVTWLSTSAGDDMVLMIAQKVLP
jgi:ribosomal protein L3 glutamine methyltransferase